MNNDAIRFQTLARELDAKTNAIDVNLLVDNMILKFFKYDTTEESNIKF
jgi:hypothetical protein